MKRNTQAKGKLNVEKILKGIKLILFGAAMILIYVVSPRITYNVQNAAKWLYELDCNYVTRAIELILFVIVVIINFIKKQED